MKASRVADMVFEKADVEEVKSYHMLSAEEKWPQNLSLAPEHRKLCLVCIALAWGFVHFEERRDKF